METTLTTQQKQLNILIVDDDQRLCDALGDILEAKGYLVGVAHDSREAVERLKRTRHDLVFIDIMMAGMNGVETLREIKTVNPQVTIMIISGRSQLEGFVSEALWAGADGVIYKPFEMNAVLETIERKLKEQASQQQIDLQKIEITEEVLKLVPKEMAHKYILLPLRVESGYLVVAMADPNNLYAIEDLRVRTTLRIRPIKVARAEIERALAAHYQESGEIERQIERITPIASELESQLAEKLSDEMVSNTPVVRAVELMLRQAVRDKASDIHLEPQEDHLQIRFRIDGVLHDGMRLPLRVHAPLISRIKVLSNLNIAERRRPQDGQFSITVDNNPIDFRVATINTIHGEMAVLRVLDKSVSVRGLDELGFLPDMLATWEQMIRSPWGIILISGPTGSGKTSTLYASINQLDKAESKIITIEDPVEYRFAGLSQVQVNRQAGVTFASGLRAAMRLDPDVILVGEIRDQETAETAVQASLTGHLVLSSIHANDTVGAIFRLIDLGVEPFLVTSSLLGVLSQRLVRRVCTKCRTPQEAPEPERLAYEQALGESRTQFDYGVGCSNCADTGYRGRLAVFELLQVNDAIRRAVLRGANSDELRRAALESGMSTMLHEGMKRVREGLTTPTEILKKIFALT